jgi:fumarate reductase subunit D
LKKPLVIGLLFILSLILFYLYNLYKIPEGLTPQGDDTQTLAWISFATAVVSMVTALIGLIKQVVEKE